MTAIIHKQKKRGISLMEVLIVAVIFSIMGTVLINAYIQGTRMWNLTTANSDLRIVAYLAMNNMVNELRRTTRTATSNPSPNLAIPSKPNNHSVDFYLPKDTDTDNNTLIIDDFGNTEWETNNMIQYQYIPGQKRLRRLEKGQQDIIADDVELIEFEDASITPSLYNDELTIALTLSRATRDGRTVTASVNSIVKLRN